MSAVSGACLVSKKAGMLHVREDTAPPTLEWVAVENQSDKISIALNTLTNLQAPKETSPKMMLIVTYRLNDEDQRLKLTFNNRPTMNFIKESLQTIVARSRTVIKDATPTSQIATPVDLLTPVPSTPAPSASTPGPEAISASGDRISLSDSALLKNHKLQQKLLLEDKVLYDTFKQSVIHYKLSPTIFWSTRISQLRTYALTISQHRGPYNVLSTIKPVATSDNQVNVNVTRDMINEIFDTYPLIRKAFSDLVPLKIQEGEFWSRFFNSKLFRRLRGDKIRPNDRGDLIIDKYLYVDPDFLEKKQEDDESIREQIATLGERSVNKFIDIAGNEEDNSQKLGNRPDFTMRYVDIDPKVKQTLNFGGPGGQENEMVLLMKNMNKLSSKMIQMSEKNSDEGNNSITSSTDTITKSKPTDLSQAEFNEFAEELDLHDLHETKPTQFVKLNVGKIESQRDLEIQAHSNQQHLHTPMDDKAIEAYISSNIVESVPGGISLADTFESRQEDINKSANEIISLTKMNSRAYKTNLGSSHLDQLSPLNNSITMEDMQSIIRFNITITEYLSHFWKLYLYGDNPIQLKKLFGSLRDYNESLVALKKEYISKLRAKTGLVGDPDKIEKLIEKAIKDLENCWRPMELELAKATTDYVLQVRLQLKEGETNENGKRPLET